MNIKISIPKVIFFDAVGTLFGVRGSVGQVYADLASQFGVKVAADQINLAFAQSFQSANSSSFAGVNQSDVPALEFEWWQAIATQTFQQAGVINDFADFPGFFAELYSYFATAKPWFVYPDVLPVLEQLHQTQITLGVISNFDTRLYSVLKALDLAKYFSSVTISTEVGAAKPDPHIFRVGLKKHRCLTINAWHIGDSYKEDYQAAKTVGMRGILINRDRQTISS